MDKKFNIIFVTQSTRHDFSKLKEYAEKVVYLSSGYEELLDIYSTIAENLIDRGFNPDTDAILPVGKVSHALIAGIVLGKMCNSKITTAIFDGNGDYIFV